MLTTDTFNYLEWIHVSLTNFNIMADIMLLIILRSYKLITITDNKELFNFAHAIIY